MTHLSLPPIPFVFLSYIHSIPVLSFHLHSLILSLSQHLHLIFLPTLVPFTIFHSSVLLSHTHSIPVLFSHLHPFILSLPQYLHFISLPALVPFLSFTPHPFYLILIQFLFCPPISIFLYFPFLNTFNFISLLAFLPFPSFTPPLHPLFFTLPRQPLFPFLPLSEIRAAIFLNSHPFPFPGFFWALLEARFTSPYKKIWFLQLPQGKKLHRLYLSPSAPTFLFFFPGLLLHLPVLTLISFTPSSFLSPSFLSVTSSFF